MTVEYIFVVILKIYKNIELFIKICIRIQNGFKFSCEGKRGCLLSENSLEAGKYLLPRRLPEANVCKMEITIYPLHVQSIGPISTALDRGS